MPRTTQANRRNQRQPSLDTVPICSTRCPKHLSSGPRWSSPSHSPPLRHHGQQDPQKHTRCLRSSVPRSWRSGLRAPRPGQPLPLNLSSPIPGPRQAVLPVIFPSGSGNVLSNPPALKTSAIFHGFVGDHLIRVWVHDSDSELRGQGLLGCAFTSVSPAPGAMPSA